ncbi:MAG: hypothetical protein ACXWMJ_09930, partial [Syntrophales bacterium]
MIKFHLRMRIVIAPGNAVGPVGNRDRQVGVECGPVGQLIAEIGFQRGWSEIKTAGATPTAFPSHTWPARCPPTARASTASSARCPTSAWSYAARM